MNILILAMAIACDTPPEAPVVPVPSPVVPVAGAPDCGTLITDHLADREALNTCKTDSDCAEIWPGLCPHGPYYVNREADIGPIFDQISAIHAQCMVPMCEPPMQLGIAHCEDGRCAAGRSEPVSTDLKSCWDFRETYLEASGATSLQTVAGIQGITPHTVIVPATPGTLTITVDFPADCAGCALVVSEHNSGMARKVDTTASATEPININTRDMIRSTIEIPVTPGPYHMVPTSDEAGQSVLIKVKLLDSSGEAGHTTRHGIAWQRMCEG